jgi:hypothetical protein
MPEASLRAIQPKEGLFPPPQLTADSSSNQGCFADEIVALIEETDFAIWSGEPPEDVTCVFKNGSRREVSALSHQ